MGGPPPGRRSSTASKNGSGLSTIPGATAVGVVIHGLVPVVRVLAQLHDPVAHQPLLRGTPQNTDPERYFEHLGEERHDVNRQHRSLPRRRSGPARAPPPHATSRRRTTAATRGGMRAAAPRPAAPPRRHAPRSRPAAGPWA